MISRRSITHIYLHLVYLFLYNEAKSFYNETKSYRAVVIIHGVLTGSDSMDLITNRIQEVRQITDFHKILRSLTIIIISQLKTNCSIIRHV